MPPAQPAPSPWLRLILLLAALAIALTVWFYRNQKSRLQLIPADALQMLSAFENKAATQYWKAELNAQERLRTVTALWDAINRSTNKLSTALAQFAPGELVLPAFTSGTTLPHGISVFTPAASGTDPVAYAQLLDLSRGWQLDQCEFRFIAIDPDKFYVSLHFTHPGLQQRAILEGDVLVQFSASHTLQRVDASRLELRTRTGPPAFAEVFQAEVAPPAGSFFIDPLMVWDLDGDAQLEVILAAANRVFRRSPAGWTPGRLLHHDPGLLLTALLGDFTGDGATDFLCAQFDGLHIFEGATQPQAVSPFPDPPRPAWAAQPRLRYPQTLTAGDIDLDGDLDLFLGQYKPPYTKGQMPFPYYDANDGYPSFLLLNDGRGNFTDATQKAGLAAKRGRRAYSSSLVDLDGDSDLDLLVVSDFAGLDAFENNGSGVFADATKKWFSETRAFGMAHSFADFNRDGRLDILMVGMNSPAADRLESLGLNREYTQPDAGLRRAVTFGNRLYLGQSNGTFRQGDLSEKVARTGWSWGSAAGDLDNDGFPDLYIANGHESRASVAEYEPEFWLHDIYVGNSQENTLVESYFRQKYSRTRGQGQSYGGYEKNRLFLNLGGTNMAEVAHLFGVGMEQDSRNVALQDLNADGRLDLIVTTFEVYPKVRQTIRLFQNQLLSVGNHLSIALKNQKFTGASSTIAGTRTNAFAIVSGESYRTQLPLTAHIGAGTAGSAAVNVSTGTNIFILNAGPK